VALPNVSKVPSDVEAHSFVPLREWLQKYWLRGRQASQVEVDQMSDLAAGICIQNYVEQFRTLILRTHEGAFKVLAAGSHRSWKMHVDAKIDAVDKDVARELLASARRDYVEAIRLLGTVAKICAFHDGNFPRESLSVKLVKRLQYHMLEKDVFVLKALQTVLGTSDEHPAAWAECFPDPNDKPQKVEATIAHVAYGGTGHRHWITGNSKAKAGQGDSSSNASTGKALQPSAAVVVSAGGGTLVTSVATKNACLPLLPGVVPVRGCRCSTGMWLHVQGARCFMCSIALFDCFHRSCPLTKKTVGQEKNTTKVMIARQSISLLAWKELM